MGCKMSCVDRTENGAQSEVMVNDKTELKRKKEFSLNPKKDDLKRDHKKLLN